MKKVIRTVIIGLVFVLLIGGYYFYLTKRSGSGAQSKLPNETPVEKLLNTDLEQNYPTTPRAVIQMYNRFLKCMYGEDYSDQQFVNMVEKQKVLFDQELLDNNPQNQYIQNVRADVKKCKSEKRSIRNTSICGSNEVVYKTVDKRDCAYVSCSYFMKVADDYETTTQQYVLRKDNTGCWKILVYYIIRGETK